MPFTQVFEIYDVRESDSWPRLQNTFFALLECFASKLGFFLDLYFVSGHEHSKNHDGFGLEKTFTEQLVKSLVEIRGELSSPAPKTRPRALTKRHKSISRPVTKKPAGFESIWIIPVTSLWDPGLRTVQYRITIIQTHGCSVTRG